MAVNFMQSATKENLMRAFAGECQARARYEFAAAQAKQNKLNVLEEVFHFTAQQEKEHAEIFYNFLAQFSGENILVNASYPIDSKGNLEQMLRDSKHNEYEEYQVVYNNFAQIAKDEGFDKISSAFYMISEIEKYHGDRFEYYANLMAQNQLFSDPAEPQWMCLNCGHLHTGKETPNVCPVCSHAQGYFIRLAEAPFRA